ncbi:MAG: c-type cytochrome biogenesis protein CcmI [Gammaproteobacteria bacterium]
MTLFWVLVAAMVLVALAFVVTPLLRHREKAEQSRRELNVAIFRERISDLDEDLAEGAISEEQHRQARAELERDLLEDTANENAPAASTSGRWAAALLVFAVPLLAVGIYWQIGAHHLVEGVGSQAQPQGPSVEEMINRLAERMKENPGDPEGWMMLGRSYMATDRFPQAVEAYAKAYELLGDQPQVLTDYAEAISMTAGASMAGRPLELIQKALSIDPNYTKALWLAGVAAYQGGEPASALALWRKLQGLLPPEGDNAEVVRQTIARVEAELGRSPAPEPSTAATATGEARIEVAVALAEELKGRVAPEDTVFVFARALQGPPAPLAAVRLQVKDLPAVVTLDDSLAMMTNRKLSSQSAVQLMARISRSGGVRAASGDLEGSLDSVPVAAGKTVSLTIDRVVP